MPNSSAAGSRSGRYSTRGKSGPGAGADPQRRSYASYASFSDPDGNGWILQEVKNRAPDEIGTIPWIWRPGRPAAETALHHGEFEAVAPPHDWWDSYAACADARNGGSAAAGGHPITGHYMAEVKHVVVTGA